jgi:hypothetical protein
LSRNNFSEKFHHKGKERKGEGAVRDVRTLGFCFCFSEGKIVDRRWEPNRFILRKRKNGRQWPCCSMEASQVLRAQKYIFSDQAINNEEVWWRRS